MGRRKGNRTRARNGHWMQRLALNIGAILGSLCLLLALAAVLFGLKPLVFASGSMGPSIPTGSLGLAVPVPIQDVEVGDVVSVIAGDELRVTHRVAEKTDEGLVLKGDANPVADLQPYAVDKVDKLLISVPVLGYVVSGLSQPWAYFLGGLLCAYLLYIAFFRKESAGGTGTAGDEAAPATGLDAEASKSPEPEGGKPRRSPGASPILAVVLVLSMAAATFQLHPLVESTRAAFTATATASAPLQAAVMQPARTLTCSNKTPNSNNKVVDFTWQAPPTQAAKLAGYKVSVQIDSSAEEVSPLLPVGTTSYSVDISRSGGLLGLLIDLLGNLLGSNFNVNFRVYAVYENGWTSVPALYSGAKGSIALLGLDRSLRCA